MMHPLAGVYAAAVSPMGVDLSPDLDSIPGLLEFLADRGCHGALLLGTTGEGPSFSTEERKLILTAGKRVLETRPAFKLFAGTGTPSLTETAALTRNAFDLGYDGVVVLPPYYFRKATDEGLFRWFTELIGRAVPRQGTLLGYHFPGAAGIGFSPDLLARVKDAFPTQFAGIKDSSHDAGLARLLGDRFGDDLLVLTGTDSYLELAMQNHAAGCITAPANILSPELRQVWEAMNVHGQADSLQEVVTHRRELLDKFSPFPSLIKAMLHSLHGFPRWEVRPPLEKLPGERLNQVLEAYAAL
jgi:4-hydroxy-tetrahydrodipicolinate synthase